MLFEKLTEKQWLVSLSAARLSVMYPRNPAILLSNYIRPQIMRLTILTAIVISVLATAGCTPGTGFRRPISSDDMVLGFRVMDTVLVVKEDYREKDAFLPRGVYRPFEGSSDGYIQYLGSEPITVKNIFRSVQCSGGVSVKAIAPHESHLLFSYYCGHPILIYPIEGKVNFEIIEVPPQR